jgi:cytochrome c peroxidase
MSSTNVAYNASLTLASSFVRTLEEQIKIPLFNQNPIEIGLVGREALVIALLGKDERYRKLFAAVFPKKELV